MLHEIPVNELSENAFLFYWEHLLHSMYWYICCTIQDTIDGILELQLIEAYNCNNHVDNSRRNE